MSHWTKVCFAIAISLVGVSSTLAEIPAAPSNLKITRPADNVFGYAFQLHLNWDDNSDNADQFVVYGFSEIDPTIREFRFATKQTHYEVIDLQANTRYTFFVVAKAGLESSPPSESVSEYTRANMANWPSSSVGAKQTTLFVNWYNEGSNPPWTKYRVEVSSGREFKDPLLVVSSETLAHSATVEGLSPNSYYFVRVRILNGATYVPFLPPTDFFTRPVIPGLPNGEPLVGGVRSIEAHWSSNQNGPGTQYRVSAYPNERITGVNSDKEKLTRNLTATLDNLAPNIRYWITVRAINISFSDEEAGPLLLGSAISLAGIIITDLFAEAVSTDSIRLSWTVPHNSTPSISDAHFFKFYRAGSPAAIFSEVPTNNFGATRKIGERKMETLIQNLTPGTTECFEIRHSENLIDWFDYSNIACANLASMPVTSAASF